MDAVDLAFALVGDTLPLDHGYALYASLCRVVPALHQHRQIGVHPIRGEAMGEGCMRLTERSLLRIRTPAESIPCLLPLAGKNLEVDGHKLRLGVPQVFALKPAMTLVARVVTIKGFLDPVTFLDAARRQVGEMGLPDSVTLQVPLHALARLNAGQPIRRTLRVKDKTIVGFPLRVEGLALNDSLTLQSRGLGGRRHMGCGVFLPVRDQ